MSTRGLCTQCAEERLRENIAAIQTHSGPGFTRWRRQIAASVGAVLLDDLQQRG